MHGKDQVEASAGGCVHSARRNLGTVNAAARDCGVRPKGCSLKRAKMGADPDHLPLANRFFYFAGGRNSCVTDELVQEIERLGGTVEDAVAPRTGLIITEQCPSLLRRCIYCGVGDQAKGRPWVQSLSGVWALLNRGVYPWPGPNPEPQRTGMRRASA